MYPDGVTKCQHVAAVNFADDLVTSGKVKQLKRIETGGRCGQQRVLHRLYHPVIQHAPVALLQSHDINTSVKRVMLSLASAR